MGNADYSILKSLVINLCVLEFELISLSLEKDIMKYIALLAAALLVGADQLIKYWAMQSLSQVGTMPVFGDVFQLAYVENRGAAFGLMQGKTWILVGLTSLVIIGAIIFLLVKKIKSNTLIWAIALIISGGIGNLIDRISRGYVVDYLYFKLIDFYVFNLADACVCIGVALVFVYMIFIESRHQKNEAKTKAADGGMSEQK